MRGCNKWAKKYKAWAAANPDKAALLESREQAPVAADLLAKIPAFPADAKLATRAAGRDVLQPLAAELPLLIGGSADLYGSTLNYIAADQDFDPDQQQEHRRRENDDLGALHGISAHLRALRRARRAYFRERQ